MNKKDLPLLIGAIALMFLWMKFYPAIEQKYFPRSEQPSEQIYPAGGGTNEVADVAVAAEPEIVPVAEAIVKRTVEAVVETDLPPETRLMLYNDEVEVTVSSYGGTVVSVQLENYPALNEEESESVILDFSKAPALRYDRLPKAGTLRSEGDTLVYEVSLGDGHIFRRTLRLAESYLLTVEDRFINTGADVWRLPELTLATGPMSNPTNTTAMRGVSSLGIDSFSAVEGVQHWHKQFGKLFKRVSSQAPEITTTSETLMQRPVDWAAVKNKFFVQILTPEDGAASLNLYVKRNMEEKRFPPETVAALLEFDDADIEAGGELTRSHRYYAGPKQYDFLKSQGMEQIEVMEFKSIGFWKFMNPVMVPLKKLLLWLLIHIGGWIRSYGVAIILITVIMRILFWPITHKGTESMKRMQALQPEMKAIKEKFKDNPKKQQEETMALYKKHKVNPMGGCLPMFVQIPVFIALFTVLRSAIELRFSKFLWIADLSEPENLFAGMIPVIGSLNILPILMAATMMWQQKLTPSGAGDAQQQKMMAIMMPVMMLFFFYTMPSGLVLYWTTSQILMIVQMLVRKKKEVPSA